MEHAGGWRTHRGLARSVVEIAAVTLDEVLDIGEEASPVLLGVAPWRRYSRRIVRHVLKER